MKNQTRGIIALVTLSIIFASIGIFSRIMQTSFALFQQTYLRMFLAFALGIFFFNKDITWKKFLKIPKKDLLLMIARAFCFYIGGVILFTLAVFNTTLGNVSLIQALPFVAVFGVIFSQERLTKGKAALIFLSFIGVTLISVTNFHDLLSWGRGQTLSLISNMFFSFSYILRKWQSDYLNNKEITEGILFFAVLFLLIGSFFLKEGFPLQGWSLAIIGALVTSALFNVLGLFLINYGFQHVKPLFASNLLTLEGFFAIILGLLLYKEIPTTQELVGGIFIICSVIGMNYLQQKKK